MIDNTLIAVVEDDAEIRDLTLGLLRREGWEAVGCEDVAAFDRLAARRRIDLALLDIMMPGEDGLSLCRRLRATGETAIFDTKTNLITMLGGGGSQVVLTQCQNVLRGDRLLVDMTTGVSRVEADNGKVQGLFIQSPGGQSGKCGTPAAPGSAPVPSPMQLIPGSKSK